MIYRNEGTCLRKIPCFCGQRYLLIDETTNKGFINSALSRVAFSPSRNSQIALLQPAPSWFASTLNALCSWFSPQWSAEHCSVLFGSQRKKKKSGRRWLLPSDYQSAVFVIWAVTSLCVESSLKEKKKKEFKWSVIAMRNSPLASFHSTCVREATW